MKNIWVVLVFSFAFVSQTSAKDGVAMSEKEWNKFVESAEGKTLDELIDTRFDKDPDVLEKRNFSKDEWGRITKTTPLVRHSKDGPVAEKKSWFQGKLYVSAGGNYGQKLNIVDGEKMGLKSSGYNVRGGIEVTRNIAIEMEYTSLPNFKARYIYNDGWINDIKIGIGLKTTMLNLKVGYPFKIKNQTIKPYVLAGFGKATVINEMIISNMANSVAESHSFKHTSNGNNCKKVGLGLEMPIYKNKLVIFSEVSRWRLNSKGEKNVDNGSMSVEFLDVKLSVINTVLNLKYIF